MYISRRGDIIGPPVWKSTISPHLSKSKHQWHTLSPLHHHTLTLPGYPTVLSHTWNPSDVKHDRRDGDRDDKRSCYHMTLAQRHILTFLHEMVGINHPFEFSSANPFWCTGNNVELARHSLSPEVSGWVFMWGSSDRFLMYHDELYTFRSCFNFLIKVSFFCLGPFPGLHTWSSINEHVG